MAEAELTKQALKETEEKKKETKSWFSRIPTAVKILGIIAIVLMVLRANNEGGSWQGSLPWIAGIIMIMYFFSQGGSSTKDYLTEPEAKALLRKRLSEKRILGEIPRTVNWNIGINCGEQFIDAKTVHYIIGFSLLHPDHTVVYKQAKIDTKFPYNLTIQDSVGKITGRETRDRVNWLKELRKFKDREGEGVFKALFSGK